MSLHDKIMNIPLEPGCSPAYDAGHRDARHAAAEIALQGDEAIALLRALHSEIAAGDGLDDLYCSFICARVRTFLATLDAQALAKDAP